MPNTNVNNFFQNEYINNLLHIKKNQILEITLNIIVCKRRMSYEEIKDSCTFIGQNKDTTKIKFLKHLLVRTLQTNPWFEKIWERYTTVNQHLNMYHIL